MVTGASGFTGRHLLLAARSAGYHCTAFGQAHDSRSNSADCFKAVNFVEMGALARELEDSNPDYIIHLAAISSIVHGNIREIYEVNQLHTLNLLQAIKISEVPVKKILLVSSGNIYGGRDKMPITEADEPKPANHYGVAKYAMELVARQYLDLPIVITRPFNYTGRGQADKFLIPKIVGAFRNKAPSIELGNLDISRDFSDVRDVVEAYLRLIKTQKTELVYNVCSGHSTPLSEIITSLGGIAGYEINVKQNQSFVRSNDVKELWGSPTLLEHTVGKFRRYSLNETLMWMYTQSV